SSLMYVTSSASLISFNATATTEIYPLSLHDALPILTSPQPNRPTGQTAPRTPVPGPSRSPIQQSACAGRQLLFSHGRIRTLLGLDRKSTRLNSSHVIISYAVFCLKTKKKTKKQLNIK